MDTPRPAEAIAIVRNPASPHVAVFIDGQEFPYLIDATAGITPVLEKGRPPSVTLTIIARQVVVDDQFLVGAQLDHDHTAQEEEPPPATTQNEFRDGGALFSDGAAPAPGEGDWSA